MMIRILATAFCLSSAAIGAESLSRAYLERAAETDFKGGTARHGLDREIARLTLNRPIEPQVFDASLEFIATGKDTVDFAMTPLIRILYLFPDRLPPELRTRMESTVLNFRYWFYRDEGDVHSSACTWTENHEALYHSLEYLAGQMFPDRKFAKTGRTGSWHMQHARAGLLAWMALRARFGFSEWLSAGYYSHDFAAMLNLVDFARDPLIARSAGRIADLVLLDTALHSFDGGIRATMGRPYPGMLMDSRTAPTASILMLATGRPNTLAPVVDAAGAIALATSHYQVPSVIPAIAESAGPFLIHESFGWDPAEGIALGLDPMHREDIFHFWASQAYDVQPLVFQGTAAACRQWHIRNHSGTWDKMASALAAVHGDVKLLPDREFHALFRVNVETFRTPDYIVSTAQDYRKGIGGFQQQPWLASLGGGACVWTNHPASDVKSSARPGFWMGNGVQPRVAQHRNVVIANYQVPRDDPFPYSHAYVPVSAFDEFVRRAGWLIGRRGDGYLAITASPQPKPGQQPDEWISQSPESAWICILGRKAEDGSFEAFSKRVASAVVKFADSTLTYREPAGLAAAFGWDSDLLVNGRPVAITSYPRYQSPFVNTARGQFVHRITAGDISQQIDLRELETVPLHGAWPR
jgi:hypothetical protein